MAQSRGWVVIAGAGPGIGASVARKFAETYNVALMTRSKSTHEPTVEAINDKHQDERAFGIASDVSKPEHVKAAFQTLTSRSDWTYLAAAVFNGAGGFLAKPFLDISEDQFSSAVGANSTGSFVFSQAALPLLLAAKGKQHPPTLLFTGATASLRGSARFAVLAGSKFVIRAVSQSLAREFGPQGVHVAHVIVDGPVRHEQRAQMYNIALDAMIDPDAIADSYWYLHTQPKSCFTHELDTRTSVEKW